MSVIDLDRQAYADAIGEPVELLDPIPAIALAFYGVTLTPFQLALPEGNQVFRARFEIDEFMTVEGVMIRYGNHPPLFRPFPGVLWVVPHDVVFVIYRA
ncbi:MAG: hypothetical protein V4641_05815 [Pseudomonadota bacterium]